MEMIVSSLVTPFGTYPGRVRGLEEPLVLDLEEDFYSSRVKGDWRWSRSRDVVVGLRRELTKMLSSNSFASESKEEMNDDRSRLYHIRAGPLTVVRKARHIRASKVS
ncbi:hypothetical protein GW17_00048835 [Ensete ventricosum]|nr:hypothetical protein GW17_00048835 [Ensete ventricosum]